jgi:hypothetical protein
MTSPLFDAISTGPLSIGSDFGLNGHSPPNSQADAQSCARRQGHWHFHSLSLQDFDAQRACFGDDCFFISLAVGSSSPVVTSPLLPTPSSPIHHPPPHHGYRKHRVACRHEGRRSILRPPRHPAELAMGTGDQPILPCRAGRVGRVARELQAFLSRSPARFQRVRLQ